MATLVAARKPDTLARLLDRGAIHFFEHWSTHDRFIGRSSMRSAKHRAQKRKHFVPRPAISFTINHRKPINSTASAVRYPFCAVHLFRAAITE
jgi:hypothetical protein